MMFEEWSLEWASNSDLCQCFPIRDIWLADVKSKCIYHMHTIKSSVSQTNKLLSMLTCAPDCAGVNPTQDLRFSWRWRFKLSSGL